MNVVRDLLISSLFFTCRPSSVLGTYIVPLKEAQGAYEALLVGNTVGVEFTYE